MTALICDVCGGTLAMDASGEFAVCESCGMKHSKERVKVKVQEIQGTVKIDGAVETVKGDAEKERLLKNAETFIALDQRNDAYKIYKQIQHDYPNDYRSYLGIALISAKDIQDKIVQLKLMYDENGNVKEAHRFSKISISDSLKDLNDIRKQLFVISPYHCNNIDKFENEIIDYYSKIKNVPLINEISSDIIYCGSDVSNFSKIINSWSKNLTNRFISSVLNGNSRFVEIPLHCEKMEEAEFFNNTCSGGNQEFKDLFSIGKSCGAFLNCHKYILDDILLKDMKSYYREEVILFAIGNTLLFRGDCEYVPSIRIADTILIKGLSDLQAIANTKNPNKYCPRCGGEFKGVFNKVCSKCGKPKDY